MPPCIAADLTMLIGIRILGAITPIGGMAFLLAWAMLASAAIQKKS
jgi:uncharacterized membrane protein YgdD (TMEM256/DUF423 family)